jgi:hypothetical protein
MGVCFRLPPPCSPRPLHRNKPADEHSSPPAVALGLQHIFSLWYSLHRTLVRLSREREPMTWLCQVLDTGLSVRSSGIKCTAGSSAEPCWSGSSGVEFSTPLSRWLRQRNPRSALGHRVRCQKVVKYQRRRGDAGQTRSPPVWLASPYFTPLRSTPVYLSKPITHGCFRKIKVLLAKHLRVLDGPV